MFNLCKQDQNIEMEEGCEVTGVKVDGKTTEQYIQRVLDLKEDREPFDLEAKVFVGHNAYLNFIHHQFYFD